MLAADRLIPGDDGRPVGRRKRRQRRLDARPSRLAMYMGEQRLDAGDQRLAVEQLADRNRFGQRCSITRTIEAGAEIGIEIGGGRDATRERPRTGVGQRRLGRRKDLEPRRDARGRITTTL